jgi:hypothetical protein
MELPVARNWVREAMESAVHEARLYLETGIGFARHPGLFASEWAAGERRAMNPLGFLATSLAIVGAFGQLDRIWPAPGGGKPSFLGDALEAAGPYLHAAVLALLVHAVLRARRSRRPLLDSLAAALYATGVAQVVATVLIALTQIGFRKPIVEFAQSSLGTALLSLAIVIPSLFFGVALVLALAAIHGMPRRWPAVALVLGWLLTGALLSWLQPPGRYGLHPQFGMSDKNVTVGLGI